MSSSFGRRGHRRLRKIDLLSIPFSLTSDLSLSTEFQEINTDIKFLTKKEKKTIHIYRQDLVMAKCGSGTIFQRDLGPDQSLQPFGQYVGDFKIEETVAEDDPDLELSEECKVATKNIPRDTEWLEGQIHHWIGDEDPLQNETGLSQLGLWLINTGGGVRPFDEKRKPIHGNRLAYMVHIVENRNVDIAISIESHLDIEGANGCRKYVKCFTNCEFECAVPSALAAKMTVSDTPEDAEDDADKGDHVSEDTRPATDGKRKHVGPAGIVMVMSPEMRARMR